MSVSYQTPQTKDGQITKVSKSDDGTLLVDIEFNLPKYFRERIDGRAEHIHFASRSRIARLGIDMHPTMDMPEIEGAKAYLQARIRTFVSSYGVDSHLSNLVLPGLRAGRLVFCDPDRRLSSEQVYDAYKENAFQLPASFSIDNSGRVILQPHRCVYDLAHPVNLNELLSIVARHDGAVILNRLQTRRDVRHIVLEPKDGAITSCTMYLHRHFMVLDTESTGLGMHLQAVVLDPVTTRGSRVYLEFGNNSETTIINPSVAGTLYLADPVQQRTKTWYGMLHSSENGEAYDANAAYGELVQLYERMGEQSDQSYLNRPVAVLSNVEETLAGAPFDQLWTCPEEVSKSSIEILAARQRAYSDISYQKYCGTNILEKVPENARATVLLRYFPNLIEHMQLCIAALKRKVRRLVFRQASFEHGPFLSAHDHGRLADYHALGVDVKWCNDACQHVAAHVYRGLRGYFCPVNQVNQFKKSLIVAFYGSTKALPVNQITRVEKLLCRLTEFFGGNLAILTGGGPGAMEQIMDLGRSRNLLVGSSFLELVDQQLAPNVHFYQTFQENSRHSRQRWFEISSFQIFCIGGLGTMEEIGLTLTDMKLNVMDLRPLVFFGRQDSDLYWGSLKQQLEVIAAEGRGPDWLRTHVLMTDDPEEVIDFYQRLLDVG